MDYIQLIWQIVLGKSDVILCAFYCTVWQECYYADKVIIILCMQSIWSCFIIFHFFILYCVRITVLQIASTSISINM